MIYCKQKKLVGFPLFALEWGEASCKLEICTTAVHSAMNMMMAVMFDRESQQP